MEGSVQIKLFKLLDYTGKICVQTFGNIVKKQVNFPVDLRFPNMETYFYAKKEQDKFDKFDKIILKNRTYNCQIHSLEEDSACCMKIHQLLHNAQVSYANINDIVLYNITVYFSNHTFFITLSLLVLPERKTLLEKICEKLEEANIYPEFDNEDTRIGYYLVRVDPILIKVKNNFHNSMGYIDFILSPKDIETSTDIIIEKVRRYEQYDKRRYICRYVVLQFMLSMKQLQIFPKEIIEMIGKLIYKSRYDNCWLSAFKI